ncbi:WD40 repeat-like protein [Eremomyces bilateralis CBS 781.70]|uniref:WD40 repeat-like protein n=1 Tax=Eremomyces bilateralis CBS 781.70 TaxID=1392243 RepID=A0A6G1GGW7_9PEZI|nr:WD40 repeat-like protein [Eremomyces bilateralis CBS 781.70]KAF1817254.1 WD40 repeat-like protein [Eremomyces bilateralis CBS 781.70]
MSLGDVDLPARTSAPPLSLIELSTRIPITALNHFHPYVFSAEGPFLKVYHRPSSTLYTKGKVFATQSIHDILVRDVGDTRCLLVVRGGRCVKAVVFEFTEAENGGCKLHLGKLHILDDWVLSAQLRPQEHGSPTGVINGNHVKSLVSVIGAAVSAHNGVTLFEVAVYEDTKNQKNQTQLHIKSHVQELKPNSRTLLFSACIKWTTPSDLLIASGSCYGEICVWSCRTTASQNAFPILHILPGHEGSIFDLDISDAIAAPNLRAPRRLLASCSDDRTIRVWDVSDADGRTRDLSIQDAELHLGSQYSGFGFQDSLEQDISSTRPLASVWAHQSRIWDVRFSNLLSADKSLPAVLSAGEDASLQVRDLQWCEGGLQVTHRSTFVGHAGKHAWAVCVARNLDGSVDVFSGGADGRILCHAADGHGDGRVIEQEDWTAADFLDVQSLGCTPFRLDSDEMEGTESTMDAMVVLKNDFARSFCFVADDTILVSMNSGNLLRIDRNSGDAGCVSKWHIEGIGSIGSLSGLAMMASIPELGVAFLVGKQPIGYLIEPTRQSLTPITLDPRRVTGLLFGQVASSSRTPVLMACLNYHAGDPQLYMMKMADGELASSYVLMSMTLFSASGLPLVPTSLAGVYDSTGINAIAVVGSRHGHICFYTRSLNGHLAAGSHGGDSVEPSMFIKHAHGEEAVTAIKILDTPSSGVWLASTGRDGFLKIHHVDLARSRADLIHELRPPFGLDIEGMTFDKTQGTLIIYGFQQRQFVAYDAITETRLLSIDCGGAHRSWCFHLVPNDGGMPACTLVWTQARKLRLHRQERPVAKTVKVGLHGREIKACDVTRRRMAESEDEVALIATGAEDTDIRIIKYQSADRETKAAGEPELVQVATIRQHTTGIQHLQWSETGDRLFSSGGFEEFYVWRVQAVPILGLGVTRESTYPISRPETDLRITCFQAVGEGGSTSESGGPERSYKIAMAFSNSKLKLWRYETGPDKPTWTHLMTFTYTTNCLTQCAMLNFAATNYAVIGSTNGFLAFVKHNEDQPPSSGVKIGPFSRLLVHQTAAHQNAVMTSSIVHLKDRALILSGGDDDAISVVLAEQTPEKLIVSSVVVQSAHTAAVTGSAIISAAARGDVWRILAVTAGNDQKIRLQQSGEQTVCRR